MLRLVVGGWKLIEFLEWVRLELVKLVELLISLGMVLKILLMIILESFLEVMVVLVGV